MKDHPYLCHLSLVIFAYAMMLVGCADRPTQAQQSGQPQPVSVASDVADDPERESLTREAANYSLTLITEREPVDFDDSPPWGTTSEEVAVVKSMRINNQGQKVFVPRSAFSDLSNVRDINVQTSSDDLRVELRGGSGGEGYVAVVFIEKDQVVRREVRSRTFPDHWNEVTVYRNENPIPDE